jgi:hypothetical protein
LTRVYAFADYSEINVVTRALISVASEAQGLEIGEVILATVLPWHDMVNLNSSLIRRHTAQFAPKTSAL